MRYSTEPKFRKYVEGYGFLSFARKFEDKNDKKLIDAPTKTGLDTAKTTSKSVVQKTAEVKGDLIGNKTAYKFLLYVKQKIKKEKLKTKDSHTTKKTENY